MCKILAFTNATGLKINKLTQVAALLLSETEKDGLGFAAVGRQGVFGQKTLTSRFLSYPLPHNRLCIDLPIIEQRRESFGQSSELIGPAIFHGRTSTNSKGIKNCHPMQRDNWHLVHNGVVRDHGPMYQKNTNNDSEDLLHRYILGLDQVETHLTGYYAFAAIDPDGALHILRDSIATLYVARVESPAGLVFGTTEALIRRACKKLKLTYGPIEKFQDDTLAVFVGNELTAHEKVTPRGYTVEESQFAQWSLGRKIVPDNLPGVVDVSTGLVQRSVFNPDEARARWDLELRKLDAAYTVYNWDDKPISLSDFRKMDSISQELCTIVRPDGTVFDPEMDDSEAVDAETFLKTVG